MIRSPSTRRRDDRLPETGGRYKGALRCAKKVGHLRGGAGASGPEPGVVEETAGLLVPPKKSVSNAASGVRVCVGAAVAGGGGGGGGADEKPNSNKSPETGFGGGMAVGSVTAKYRLYVSLAIKKGERLLPVPENCPCWRMLLTRTSSGRFELEKKSTASPPTGNVSAAWGGRKIRPFQLTGDKTLVPFVNSQENRIEAGFVSSRDSPFTSGSELHRLVTGGVNWRGDWARCCVEARCTAGESEGQEA